MTTFNRRDFLKSCLVGGAAASLSSSFFWTSCRRAEKLPNILLIYSDDLGYGDVGAYNPESKVPTQNLDRLVRQGIRFTDAHSPAAVCTPSRYSLMTGRMAFRAGMGGVFTGAGGPSLIEPGRLTLAQMLREKGYATACFGKWHIGMTFYDTEGKPINENGLDAVKRIDYDRRIDGGPVDVGFDQFFGTACCPTTDWLYAYIDGDRIPVPPTQVLDKTRLPKHPYATDNRPGMIAPDFNLEEVDLVFLAKSTAFIENHVKSKPDRPFFLYHASQGVHLPSFAADRFKGQTHAGPHGDFLFELDAVVGELLGTLDRLGVAGNTLVIFSSDNGPETLTTYHMRTDQGHDPAHPWRGMKRDQWEGGHRVPLIARWPGRIKPGSVTNQLSSLTDVMATVASIVGADLPENAGEDSYDMLPVLLGKQGDVPVRTYVLQQSSNIRYLSLRKGNWKYLDHQGSGGNKYEDNPMLQGYILPEADPAAPGQLYNLEKDPGETTNLYSQRPDIVAELKVKLEEFKATGRSAPSRKQKRGGSPF